MKRNEIKGGLFDEQGVNSYEGGNDASFFLIVRK